MTSEFEFQERDPAEQIAPEDVTKSLRKAWPPPRDTYITDGIPELLTRLSMVADVSANADDNREE